MKKTLLSSALVAIMATAFVPTTQAATSGTINFTGRVLADSCTINVNGAGATVVLPNVSTAAFGAAGSVAGATPFTIALTGCDTNTTKANMAFTAGSTIDSTTGNLKNTATGGSDVQIQLLDSGNSAINTSTNANAPVIAVAAGSGSTSLTAQYVATGATTTAGLVTSTVGFTLTYQ